MRTSIFDSQTQIIERNLRTAATATNASRVLTLAEQFELAEKLEVEKIVAKRKADNKADQKTEAPRFSGMFKYIEK